MSQSLLYNYKTWWAVLWLSEHQSYQYLNYNSTVWNIFARVCWIQDMAYSCINGVFFHNSWHHIIATRIVYFIGIGSILNPLARKYSEDTRKKGKGVKTGASHIWRSFYLSQYDWIKGSHMTKVVWLPNETDYSYCKFCGAKYALFKLPLVIICPLIGPYENFVQSWGATIFALVCFFRASLGNSPASVFKNTPYSQGHCNILSYNAECICSNLHIEHCWYMDTNISLQ